MTWLRRHKASQYEASLQISEADTQGEPAWMVEQLLRRKREELLGRWKDRETHLESIRAQEKAFEERVSKRRRVEPSNTPINPKSVNEEAEWLLGESPDSVSDGESDAFAGLSAEARAVFSCMGLGGRKKDQKEADLFDNEVKVCPILRFQECESRSIIIRKMISCRYSLPPAPIRNLANLCPNFVDRPFHLPFQNQ
jgi:chromosome transmission fidelity protein 1